MNENKRRGVEVGKKGMKKGVEVGFLVKGGWGGGFGKGNVGWGSFWI